MSPLANEPPDWDAIARHRAGESVGDEARRIAAWLEANPADAAMLDALDEAVAGDSAAQSGPAPDVETALAAVHRRMREPTPGRVLAFPGRAMRAGPNRSMTPWIAGGFAAAAAVGALAIGLGRSRPVEPSTDVTAPGAVITTAVGVRDSVRLPDGTRIVIAPGSRLAVSPSYGHGSREVTLDGMAWFSIHHDAVAPFTLHAGTAVIRDVGTAFTVRTGGGPASAVSVVVSEGSVQLSGSSASGSAYTLAAGDRGEVTADGRVMGEHGVVTEADTAWTSGRLVFRDTRMDRVRDDVRRWYGVDLQLADSSLNARRLTATFEREPVDRVLEVIALALGAQVERRDSVAVLRTGAMR